MIARLRKILGIQTLEEKVYEYQALQESLSLVKSELDDLVGDYNNNTNLYKSHVFSLKDDIQKGKSGSESLLDRVKDRYNEYFLNYIGEIAIIKGKIETQTNKLNKLLASDKDLEKAVKQYELEENYNIISKAYKSGKVSREVLEKAYKAATKQDKTKYADCIIRDKEGRFLFLKRNENNDFCPSVLCFPGGHVDLGEKFEEAAKRECEEETGLKVESCQLVGSYEDDNSTIKYFECTLEESENPFKKEQDIFLHGNEHSQYFWLSREEYLKEDLIMNLKDVLEEIYGDEIRKNEIRKSLELLEQAFEKGLVSEETIQKARSHKYIRKETKDGKINYIYVDKKDKNEDSELNIEKVKEYAKRIIEGSEHLERLSSAEEQGRIRGGSRNVESTIILGTSKGADQNGDGLDRRKEQEKILRRYAQKEGIWIKDFEKIYRGERGELFLAKGGEAKVFISKDTKSVIKIHNFTFEETPLDFLDRISIHNHLFPETSYELIGFTERDKELNFIIKQNFVKTSGEKVYVKDVDDEMSKRGFEELEGVYINSDYLLYDLHPGNVFKSPKGNFLFIDPIICLNTENSGYNGKRKLGKIKIKEDEIKKSLGVLHEALERGLITKDVLEKAESKYGAGKRVEKIKVEKDGKIYYRSQKVGRNFKEGDPDNEDHSELEKIQEFAQDASDEELGKYIESGDNDEYKELARKELLSRGKKQIIVGENVYHLEDDKFKDQQERLGKKKIDEHARTASEGDLQTTIKEHSDEEMRVAAHNELKRREEEEKPQEKINKLETSGKNEKLGTTNIDVKNVFKEVSEYKNFDFLNKELKSLTSSEYTDITSEKLWRKEFEKEDVNIDKIIPIQETLGKEVLEDHIKGKSSNSEPIRLAKLKGKYYIVNGTHRIALKILNKEKEGNFDVIDLDTLDNGRVKKSQEQDIEKGDYKLKLERLEARRTDKQYTKEEADYVNNWTNQKTQCEFCNYWTKNKCNKVIGEIQSEGHCKFWEHIEIEKSEDQDILIKSDYTKWL